jgi:membrane-bound ClpP family serine protease
MSLGLIIFFIAIGIFLFIVEFMLIPGISIAGIGGAVFILGGVIISFIEFGPTTGFLVLGGTAITLAIVVTLMLRSGTWKKFMLTTSIDSKVDLVHKADGKVKPGDRGETVTRLNPMGKVQINGEFYEAKAMDILVDPKTPVEVITVETNRLIVKPINK